MSTTESPNPLTPKGTRNSRRHQKRITTPSAQNASTLATPPSSPPGAVSPKGTASDSSGTITLSKKKGNRSTKKTRDVPRASPINRTGHRHTSSHPNNSITTPQLKDTHYAGPTFHASPAPSALPIPSFFSKTFAESDLAPTLEPDSDSFDAEQDFENTPSKPKSRAPAPQEERESTPLDFLFKAAVEARKCQPQRSPEPSPRVRSPQTDSKAIQQRKFYSDTTGVFAIEMGGSDLRHSPIGPSFAPSYKDRMNALRSASSPSPTSHELDEDERKAKTEALKTLLLNPRPQRPPFVSHSAHNQVNHDHERPVLSPMVPHFATPLRTSSGPPIVSSFGDPSGKKPPQNGFQPRPEPQHTHFNTPQYHRFQNPTVGRDVLASTPGNMSNTPRQTYGSPSPAYIQPNFSAMHPNSAYHLQLNSKSPVPQNMPASANSPAFDTKKMEDDLRRILKLDVNSSMPSSSIQSSLA